MGNKKNHMILYRAVFYLLLCSNPLCRLTLYFNTSIANHMDNSKFTRNKNNSEITHLHYHES